MPEVSVVVELRVAVDEESDPVAFEHAIAAQGRRAARELYREALRALDGLLTEAAGGARQRLEERWVATLVGRIRMWRYRVKGPGGSFHPLDRALRLGQAEPSPALREAVCDLATRLPYRQAAEVCSRLTGEAFSPLAAWRVVQAEGARVRIEENALVHSVFELGEVPPEVDPAPELVVVEADGTYLAAQREQGDRFEVKTGVFYTGKARAGGRRHRRFKLLNKGCYATTGDADAFGKGLAARGFSWVGLHRARWVLGVHDGLDEYGQGFRDWFPEAVHQVDHFHVAERIWEVSGKDPDRFEELKALAFADPVACARKLRRSRLIRPELAREVASYLEGVAPDLYGVDRLPRRLRRGRMHVVGSGVVEKHQDLLVKRRMKGKGMRWTRRGAEHLLALQARRFCGRWPTRWGAVAR
ncbi:MAG TPA: UPF0236 family protein [Arthrobacter sp.]